MTALLPELEHALPPDVQLDGELVAVDDDGRPDFHRLGERMLHGCRGIAVTYFVVKNTPTRAQLIRAALTLYKRVHVRRAP